MSDWVVALGCGLWVGALLWQVTGWAPAFAAATAGVLLFARLTPVLSALLIAAVQVVASVVVGVPSENPAGLAAALVATYSLGRHARPVLALVTVAVFTAAFVATVFSVATLIFAALVLGGTVAFGWLVRRRSESAHAALARASELERADAARLAARVVADERARIGGEALAVIRSSVEAMGAGAVAARVSLEESAIAAIADRGRAAVSELRWLLGLLRAEPDGVASGPPRRGRALVVDGCVAAAAVLIAILDGQLAAPELSPLGWTLLLALPLVLVGRRERPVVSVVAAAVVVGLIAVAGTPLMVGVGGAVLITFGLLAWTSGASGRWPQLAGLLALVGVTLAWFTAHDTVENVPMMLAVFGMPAFAGYEWTLRDRTARHAEARAAAAQADIDSRVDNAVRTERLRIARELHDVTSHAVGVMVLQASAALALRATDPDAARRALQTVESTAAQARGELAVLFDVLEAGAIGSPGLARSGSESVDALVKRMVAAGVAVSAELAPVPTALEPTVYRVVQEALTNAVRHAPGVAVEVRVSAGAGEVEVVVVNAGVGQELDDVGGGFGLTGLAERVHAHGGAFSFGSPPGGGFRVRASLPVFALHAMKEVSA